ncbi:MAG: hypothetical protein C5B58_16455 [Acidobacteria bacterium]|nr:MAG: hypothetical protein C5B58_16455 [Acidobacteriota bacterium]
MHHAQVSVCFGELPLFTTGSYTPRARVHGVWLVTPPCGRGSAFDLNDALMSTAKIEGGWWDGDHHRD